MTFDPFFRGLEPPLVLGQGGVGPQHVRSRSGGSGCPIGQAPRDQCGSCTKALDLGRTTWFGNLAFGLLIVLILWREDQLPPALIWWSVLAAIVVAGVATRV